MNDIDKLVDKINDFAKDRDWDQFHSPKNLSMALSAEVGELVEEFQWMTEEQSRNLTIDKLEKVKEEIGDVINYTLQLCSKLGVDPIRVAEDKIRKNEIKYPVSASKGNAKKYTEL
jgi:dCTP diphosphatase